MYVELAQNNKTELQSTDFAKQHKNQCQAKNIFLFIHDLGL